jgi:hypothetical protein
MEVCVAITGSGFYLKKSHLESNYQRMSFYSELYVAQV